MGWAQLGDEVTDKISQRIYSNEYFPLRILRTNYELDPQEEPAAPTLDGNGQSSLSVKLVNGCTFL